MLFRFLATKITFPGWGVKHLPVWDHAACPCIPNSGSIIRRPSIEKKKKIIQQLMLSLCMCEMGIPMQTKAGGISKHRTWNACVSSGIRISLKTDFVMDGKWDLTDPSKTAS